MKTIQMTIDEPLLEALDQELARARVSRSAFIRQAVTAALHQREIAQREAQHAQAYRDQPLTKDEFDIWQDEQAWGPS